MYITCVAGSLILLVILIMYISLLSLLEPVGVKITVWHMQPD